METTFKNKCGILADLWIQYRNEESLKDFFDYNDIALPLAFLINEQIVSESNTAIESFIEEAFMMFLVALKMEDGGFDKLDDILLNFSDEDGIF